MMDVVSVFSNSQGKAAIMYQSPELSRDAICLESDFFMIKESVIHHR